MLILVASIFVLAALDNALRGSRKALLIEEFRFELFALRDRLRNLAIDEQVKMDVWFDVVDTSLTAAVSAADKLSLLHLLAASKVTPKDHQHTMVSAFNKALSDRPHLRDVVDEYRTAVLAFVRKRNPVIAAVFMHDGDDQSRNKKQRRKVIDAVHVARDFSTLPDLVPCAA